MCSENVETLTENEKKEIVANREDHTNIHHLHMAVNINLVWFIQTIM